MVTDEEFKKYNSRFDSPSERGCWLWNGNKNKAGYGLFYFRGKQVLAHRFSFALGHEIPAGLCVLHSCDTPACVNENHLFLGTRPQNSLDMVRKRRAATGDRNGTHTHPERVARGDRSGARKHPENFQGEKNAHAKLTAEKVIELRKRYADGGITLKDLAKQYGISRLTAGDAVRRVTWKHI